jgi:hypothetical protein
MTDMTFRQTNLAVFEGAPLPGPFFQPRIEPWFELHRIRGSLPPAYRDMDVLGLYDALGLSMRYVDYYTGQPYPIERRFAPGVTVNEASTSTQGTITYVTPHGELVETLKLTQDETWRTVDFPVKGPGDLKALRWLLARTTDHFSTEKFAQGSAFVGDRGEPQFYLPKSPYQALAQQWMKFEDFIYALADRPGEIEATMQAIDDSYDELYTEITSAGVVKIVNFGENLHAQLLSPRYFEQYLIPFYERRCAQLRAAGIYSHMHLDGYFKPLLPYLKDLPFDGLEALTPLPQGDVSIDEMAAHIGDKVLLDGIPAVLFMPAYSRDELMAATEKIVKLFHPRLVLGISDELPEGVGEEGIERVRLVAEWCRRYTS